MILTYDTETTGFLTRSIPLHHPEQPRIVQIGAILDYDDGREAMRLDVVIGHSNLPEPVLKSWTKAQEIHGLSPELTLQIGVNERTAIELFLDMVEVSDVVVGHNIKGFDNDVIAATTRRVFDDPSFDPFAGKTIFDTMVVGQAICKIPFRGGGYKKPNLTELHKHFFNVGFDGAHAAINDVIAARKSFYEMQKLIKSKAA